MAIKLLDATAPPLTTPMLGPRGALAIEWERWFYRLPATLNAIPSVLNLVALSEQGAAITATDFSNGKLLEGTYRVSYHVRVSRAATTSSAVRVSITWTQGGVTQTVTGTNLTTNTTTTRESGLFLIRSDAGTAVNYSTTYSTSGATSMQYSLDVALEFIRPRGNM